MHVRVLDDRLYTRANSYRANFLVLAIRIRPFLSVLYRRGITYRVSVVATS